jgi:hypothetical protein
MQGTTFKFGALLIGQKAVFAHLLMHHFEPNWWE